MTLVQAFKKFGLDASTEESTTEKDFLEKIANWEKFDKKNNLSRHLLRLNKKEVDNFFENLEKAVSRFIESISVLPLHGVLSTLPSVEEAIYFIENHRSKDGSLPVLKYEIIVRYNNKDKVEGIFNSKESAIEFLESYAPPKPKEKK